MTAVKWLEEMISAMEAHGGDLPPLMIHIKQAKEMEKQQIIEAYKNSTCQFSVDSRIDYPKSAEQYYNETFKNK